ncbi:MAG: hypothetical protein FJZ07_02320 [Candidatus Nealsonbacteria bacterium]|nr:hypothetical protein [Candidatus Nealsonbacteria bacterium]
MLEIFVLTILFCSLLGIGVIIIKKIPALVNLAPEKVEKPKILNRMKAQIKNNKALNSFSGEILLQKLLSKIRVLTLKTENKTGIWLMELRQRALEKKNKFSCDYWEKVKKIKKINKRKKPA